MRVHVVSDVHGRTDALARAGAGADVLICLGDLVLYVDYHDHSAGIMADLFGAEAVTRLIELRTARRFDEARTWSLGLWAHFDAARGLSSKTPFAASTPRCSPYCPRRRSLPTATSKCRRYGRSSPARACMCSTARWPRSAACGWALLVADCTARCGRRTSSARTTTPPKRPRSARLTCSAATSRRPYRCCSTTPRRAGWRGSGAVLEAIWDTAPRLVLFGHVHQPLVTRTRIGRTECVNVGHFRTRRTPYVLDWAG